MNIDEKLTNAGLSREQYESALKDICDKVSGLNDMDWIEIRDKYNLDCHPDSLKKSSHTPFGGPFVKAYLEDKYSSTAPSSYVEQMAELRKEKQKLFDERVALKKLSRDDARGEENYALLESMIRANGETIFSPIYPQVTDSGNDLIACLSDFHLGIDSESIGGKYNSEIAYNRLQQYIQEILDIQSIHKSQNIYVSLLGDLISGNLHPTIQLENRENVVQQVQLAAEYISAFIFELAQHFENVYVADVSGNHSRIGMKDNVLREERLDSLIVWYTKAKLSHVTNIEYIDEKYDDTVATMTVRGHEFFMVHGDYDSFSEAGMNKLIMFVGHKPTGILLGHMHHCTYDDINNIKLIRSGSFCGSVDDYSVSKRLKGKASQMVCVVNKKGVQALYPVALD